MIYGMAGKVSRGRKRLLAVVAAVLAVAGLMVLTAWRQDAKFEAKVAQARAYGFPFEGSDLVQTFDFPESENAALYLEQLRDAHGRISFTDMQLGGELVRHSIKGAFTDEEWAALETHIQESSPVLELLEAAARSQYCYFDRDWNSGMAVMFPEYAEVKGAVRPLLARARIRLRNGDIQGAGEDIAAVQAVSKFVSEQQTMISLLVGLAIDSFVMSLIQTVLPEAATNAEASDMLRERIEANPESWNVLPMLRGQAFETIWVTENLGDMKDFAGIADMDEDMRTLFLQSKMPGAVRALKSATIDIFGPAIRDYEQGSNEREVFEAISERSELAKRNQLSALFFDILIPTYPALADALDRQRAARLCTLAALDAVDLYRITSTIPDGSAKGPHRYTDPFDGEDLRYRRDSEGFRVWSIGANRKDDGGTTRDEDNSNYDVVVVFPPVLTSFESVATSGPAGAFGSSP